MSEFYRVRFKSEIKINSQEFEERIKPIFKLYLPEFEIFDANNLDMMNDHPIQMDEEIHTQYENNDD